MTKDEIIIALLLRLKYSRQTLVQAHNCMALAGVYCPEVQYTEDGVFAIDDLFQSIGPDILKDDNLRSALNRVEFPIGINPESH